MTKLKYLAAVALLLAGCAVSFYSGREYESYYYNVDNLFQVHQQLKDSCQKHYEAACLQADFIRYIIDHFDGETEMFNIGAEIENCYEDWFGELSIEAFKTKHITHISDFDQYYWAY